jgi:DNA replication and repair protein RecF
MRINRLHIHHLRNLKQISLNPHPHFNIFWGQNGSGKTSLLEAIHMLGVGRSIRSRQIQSIIMHEHNTLSCFAEVKDDADFVTSMGIEKNRQAQVTCKIGGESCDRLSQFAGILPLQLITPETFKLLVLGAEERRRFLDWGVFHVEPSFSELCQRYQRLIKQRNAALKLASRWNSLASWDNELCQIGEKITSLREAHIASLMPFVEKARETLLPSHNIGFEYEKGWGHDLSLEEALKYSLAQDKRWGYTSVGPHRAEVSVTLGNFAAHQVLSRGQQKLLICALYLAQAQHLEATLGKKCVFLVDDLASELDNENRQRLLGLLATQGNQVFLTAVEALGWQAVCDQFGGEMFHVEQGLVLEANDFGLARP